MVAGSELIFGSVLPAGATPPGTDQRLAPIEHERFGPHRAAISAGSDFCSPRGARSAKCYV